MKKKDWSKFLAMKPKPQLKKQNNIKNIEKTVYKKTVR